MSRVTFSLHTYIIIPPYLYNTFRIYYEPTFRGAVDTYMN